MAPHGMRPADCMTELRKKGGRQSQKRTDWESRCADGKESIQERASIGTSGGGNRRTSRYAIAMLVLRAVAGNIRCTRYSRV
jgi:hypothetical protein